MHAASPEADEIVTIARVKGVSIRKLARIAGIPYPRVIRVIAGERRPQPGEFTKLRRALGIDSDAESA